MGLFSSLFSLFDDGNSSVNPASGLPMIDSCIDVGGNVFGCASFDTFGSGSLFSSDNIGGSSFSGNSFGGSAFD